MCAAVICLIISRPTSETGSRFEVCAALAGTARFHESLPWFQHNRVRSSQTNNSYYVTTLSLFLCFSCAHTNNNLYRDWCVELAQGSEYYAGMIQYLLLIRYGI